MTEEATIKLHRCWNWAGAIRKFTLFVDDQKIGTIANGKEECFKIQPGSHTIFVKGALWGKTKKLVIHLNAGETRSFECGIPWFCWVSCSPFICLFLLHCAGIHLRDLAINLMLISIVLIVSSIWLLISCFRPGFIYYLKEVP